MNRSPAPALAQELDGDDAALDLALRLLNGFELRVGGRPVSLPKGAQRLLAFLALQSGGVRRSHAAFTLWIDKSEERALANMRAALWRLRRTGFGLVESTPEQLRIGRDVSVDYVIALAHARAVLDRQPAAVEVLVRGDLLPDWYDDWLDGHRERLRQASVHALEQASGRLSVDGEHARAIDLAVQAVAVEPLRESANRALVVAHVAEGNHAEALRQYERFRFLLHSELGILPSEQMESLVAPLRLRAARPRRGAP